MSYAPKKVYVKKENGEYTVISFEKFKKLRETDTEFAAKKFVRLYYDTLVEFDKPGAKNIRSFNRHLKHLNSVKTRIDLYLRSATGTVYFDGVQLEEGNTFNRFNLIENASFEDQNAGSMPISWTASGTTANDICDSIEIQDLLYSYKFTANQTSEKTLTQDININGTENDTYILSGWVKSNRIKSGVENAQNIDSSEMITAKVHYSDGSSYTKHIDMFNECVSDWQFCSGSFDLSDDDDNTEKTPVTITVTLRSAYQANDCYFDNVQLIKDSVQSYTYDNGNLVGYSENAQNQESMEYVGADMTKSIDAEGNETNYSYDQKHNPTAVESETHVVTEYNYDANGNPITAEALDNDETDDYKIRTDTSYTSDGLFVSQTTDDEGNTVSYNYHSDTGNLMSVTDSKGTTNYTYDSNTDLPLTASKNNVTVTYGYTNGTKRNLTSLSNGYVSYAMDHDEFNNVQQTSVGTNTLATYTYGSGNGSLNRLTYGNGDYIDYLYDCYGSVSEIRQNGQTAFKWFSDNSGTSVRYIDINASREYNYNYDTTGRIVDETIKSTNYNSITLPFAKVNYAYDLNNNISSLINTAGGSKVTVDYDYQPDNLPDTVTVNNDKTKSFTYDSLNRLISSAVDLDNDITASYTYKASDRNTGSSTVYQTNKIETETVGGFNYKYTYDAAGNITGIYRRSGGVYYPFNLYTYDSFNQLTSDTDFANLIKTTYTYDTHGNITSVSKVSIDQNGTPNGTSSSTSYQYTDNTWKDKLTIYNNNTITYDTIGNPLTYRDGMTMTWQNGRELATLTMGGSTMSYTYGADGLRTTKTVDGTVSKYEYVGDQLLFEQRGEKAIHYVYDSFGNVMAAVYKANASDTEHIYYYAHNWRGDVVALYTSTGNIFARYEYDSWGKLLSVKNGYGNIITGSANFALINPIRYRGYYYDSESGLYYLQSRYYDPTTGRFVNGDSVEYLGTNGSIIGYNLFTYCDNNSINNVDINGHSSESIVLNIASIILSYAMLFTPWMKIKVIIGVCIGLASLYITYRDYNNQIRKLTKLYNERKITSSQYIQKKRNAEYWKKLGLVAAGITLVCSVLSWPGTKIINSVGYSVINALGFAKGVFFSKMCLINDLIDAMNHRPRYS